MATDVMQVLLNWLWQGTALLVVVRLVVGASGRTLNAATRERIWWMTLLAVLAIPLVHLSTLVGHAPSGIPVGIPDLTQGQRLVVDVPTSGPLLVGALWAGWLAVSVIRGVRGVVQLCSARRLALPVGAETERRLETWNEIRSRGRSASLVSSKHVHRAAVLGLGRPLIALAPEILARLSDDELDQVVVHEYAHVQRRDDLAILLQGAIHIVAGLHPAVWWLERALSTEREVACDDWVLAHTGSATRYAACLLGLAAAPDPSWSLSPRAVLSRSQLSVRVTRMLERDRNQTTVRSRAGLLVACPALVGLLAAAGAVQIVEVARDRDGATDPTSVVDRTVNVGEFTSIPTVLGTSARSRLAARLETGPPPESAWRAPKVERSAIDPVAPDRPIVPSVTPPAGVPDDLSVDLEKLGTRQLDPGKVAAVLPATFWPLSVSVPSDPVGGVAPLDLDLDEDRGGGGLQVTASPWEASWRPMAAAGVAIGEGSQKAAVKTAVFFGQLGKRFAGSF